MRQGLILEFTALLGMSLLYSTRRLSFKHSSNHDRQIQNKFVIGKQISGWSGAARIFFPAGIRMEEMSIVVSVSVQQTPFFFARKMIS